MKLFQFATAILLVALMLGCSSVSIKTDYDREYDFSTFKTYRWASGQEINPQDELTKYPLALQDAYLDNEGYLRVKMDSLLGNSQHRS